MGKVFRLRGKIAEPAKKKSGKKRRCPNCGKSFSKYKLRKNSDGKVISRHCRYCNYKFPKKNAKNS